ncbi:MAG: signal peptide peptidase SppA [Lacipirellulaceae bacterium]
MENSPSTTVPTGSTTVIVKERQSLFGRFGKLLLVAVGLCVLACVGMAGAYQQYFGRGEGPRERYHSLSETATDKVAIVKITGAIMEGDDFVEKQLDAVRDDPAVKAIVLRVDSPGGTVTYSDRLLHLLKKLAKDRELPVVVSMGSVCASGGYYVSMAVGDTPDSIFAEPTTWTGSIGVVIPHYNFSRLMGVTGVRDDSITSGELKLMGSPTRVMSEKEREVLQKLVDLSFARFKEVVSGGRPKFRDDPAALDAVATGQVFTADQALEAGLVDKLDFIEGAIARAAELAGKAADNVRAVEYAKQRSPIEALLGARAAEKPATAGGFDVSALVRLSTPRAYYLSTTVPLLVDALK